MNREDIIRMAIEAGLNLYVNDLTEKQYIEVVEHFAALVASAENSACIVDIQMHIPRSGRDTAEYQMAMRMIERIRARKSGYE